MATITPETSATARWAEGLLPFYAEFFADPVYQAFYGGSGYANFGYWKDDTTTARDASNNLVDAIVALLPDSDGDVLDVGCGQGATTERLASRIDSSRLTAINIDPAQVAAARQRLPDVRFLEMDAAAMSFPSDCFDRLVSVEAAFHFDTRRRFFGEAFRVLRPGGALALSDLSMAWGSPLVPAANHLQGASAYAHQLSAAGFTDVTIRDVTARTWRRYRRQFTRFLSEKPGLAYSMNGLRDLYTLNVNSSWAIRACYLVAARKP